MRSFVARGTSLPRRVSGKWPLPTAVTTFPSTVFGGPADREREFRAKNERSRTEPIYRGARPQNHPGGVVLDGGSSCACRTRLPLARFETLICCCCCSRHGHNGNTILLSQAGYRCYTSKVLFAWLSNYIASYFAFLLPLAQTLLVCLQRIARQQHT